MDSKPADCGTCNTWWRLPLLLAIVLLAVVLLRSASIRESTTDTGPDSTTMAGAEDDAAAEAVSLTIDFGDGRVESYEPVAWREGMTVRELTRETPRGDRRLEVRGTGETAFLASLDGLANEGSGGRNWLYSVNGESGDRSFAIRELKPGDHVLWAFKDQQ